MLGDWYSWKYSYREYASGIIVWPFVFIDRHLQLVSTSCVIHPTIIT